MKNVEEKKAIINYALENIYDICIVKIKIKIMIKIKSLLIKLKLKLI